MMRLWRGVIGVLAAATMVAAVAGCGSESTTAGSQLPELELPSLDGESSVQLDEVTGVTVVNLWATWCAPCRRELPDFEEVHRAMIDDVRFIGVNIGDRPADAARFIDELGVTFEQYLDFDGSLNEALSTATLPVTVVTDAEGRITTTHSGPMDAAELIELIERAQNADSDS